MDGAIFKHDLGLVIMQRFPAFDSAVLNRLVDFLYNIINMRIVIEASQDILKVAIAFETMISCKCYAGCCAR